MKQTLIIFLTLLAVIFAMTGCDTEAKQKVEAYKEAQIDAEINNKFTIYSGNCICYKKTIENGATKMRYTPVDEGFGKLIIGSNKKSFNFYFKDKLIFTKSEYDSYYDQEGGQGFTSDASAEAHRYIAEKKLDVEYNGYQFEIVHYTEDKQ
jgi:hypothetical protein